MGFACVRACVSVCVCVYVCCHFITTAAVLVLLRVIELCVWVQKKQKHMQTTPPLRAKQGIMGKGVEAGMPMRLKCLFGGKHTIKLSKRKKPQKVAVDKSLSNVMIVACHISGQNKRNSCFC